jgi:hypothetical protein
MNNLTEKANELKIRLQYLLDDQQKTIGFIKWLQKNKSENVETIKRAKQQLTEIQQDIQKLNLN